MTSYRVAIDPPFVRKELDNDNITDDMTIIVSFSNDLFKNLPKTWNGTFFDASKFRMELYDLGFRDVYDRHEQDITLNVIYGVL